ncbi:uncharacterized protein LOC135813091 [Sycon ciliatum]|uniref:uncharacterized protein LOC135813091 n=1 Tax=Sycon ciliatum TaxID=27933 RepID=UPI0031F656D1
MASVCKSAVQTWGNNEWGQTGQMTSGSKSALGAAAFTDGVQMLYEWSCPASSPWPVMVKPTPGKSPPTMPISFSRAAASEMKRRNESHATAVAGDAKRVCLPDANADGEVEVHDGEGAGPIVLECGRFSGLVHGDVYASDVLEKRVDSGDHGNDPNGGAVTPPINEDCASSTPQDGGDTSTSAELRGTGQELVAEHLEDANANTSDNNNNTGSSSGSGGGGGSAAGAGASGSVRAFHNTHLADVKCASNHTFVTTVSKEVITFGHSYTGQLGTDEIPRHGIQGPLVLRPANFLTSDGQVDTEAEDDRIDLIGSLCQHTVLVTEKGHIYGCGSNYDHQLSNDIPKSTYDQFKGTPRRIFLNFRENIRGVAVGRQHTVFLTDGGFVHTCG